jgi:hypothetical protein
MEFVPGFLWKDAFEVFFCLLDVFPRTKAPAPSQAMNVSIHGEREDAESLRHHHGGSFVADSGQSLQGSEVSRNIPAVAL